MENSPIAVDTLPASATVKVNWEKLSHVGAVAAFFEEDFTGYQALIESRFPQLQQMGDTELNKLAQLRALEVTNGCLQWSFRQQRPDCLSAEQTRECMRLVIGFIKQKEIIFPSLGSVKFGEELARLSDEVSQLYWDAFKHHVPGANRAFYAASAAQFLVCGRSRLEAAIALVERDYHAVFTPHFIDKARHYIEAYLACLED